MGHADARHIKGTEMPNVTFSSPLLHKDLTVYAIAGDTSTVLAIAEANKVPIPHDCRNGECGSCLIEVVTLSGKTMGSLLTENEKTQLKSIGKITPRKSARRKSRTSRQSFAWPVNMWCATRTFW